MLGMGKFCSAFKCSNTNTKGKKKDGISFHQFPHNNSFLLKEWLVQIKRKDFVPSVYSFLCSDHFKEDDFVYQPFTGRRQLRKGAIPSKFAVTQEEKSSPGTSYEFSPSVCMPEPKGPNDSRLPQEVQTDFTGGVFVHFFRWIQREGSSAKTCTPSSETGDR